jgi:hypothetical protein
MGIRSLTSYMLQHEDEGVFQRCRLGQCHVVVDGNNLRYALYSACPRLYSGFGGDYARYAAFVDSFWAKLASCGISSHVVLDGAYDTSEVKRGTVMRRLKDQVRSATATAKANHHDKVTVMPLFAKGKHTKKATLDPLTNERWLTFFPDVFVECCRRAEGVVEVLQTPFEADATMASMALDLDCPLVSG